MRTQYRGPQQSGVSMQGSLIQGSLNTRGPQYRGPLHTGGPSIQGTQYNGPSIQGVLNTGVPQYKGPSIQGVLKTRGLSIQTSSLQRKHRGHPCRGSLIERCPSCKVSHTRSFTCLFSICCPLHFIEGSAMS